MFKYQLIIILSFSFILSSCEKRLKKTLCNQENLMNIDSVYNIKKYELKFADYIEEIELYTTKKKDTFINSNKVTYKDSVCRKLSFYYDLKIYTSETPNLYNGEIILYSYNYDFRSTKSRRKTIYFAYNNLCKDSLYTKVIVSKSNLPIKFKFENCYNNTLQGSLVEIIEIDTLQNKIRQKIDKLAVDNYIVTDNMLFDSYKIDKRFSLKDYIKEKKEPK